MIVSHYVLGGWCADLTCQARCLSVGRPHPRVYRKRDFLPRNETSALLGENRGITPSAAARGSDSFRARKHATFRRYGEAAQWLWLRMHRNHCPPYDLRALSPGLRHGTAPVSMSPIAASMPSVR
ncbi:hypothetical protein ABIA39_008537 [Nocardia sp. GAS34]